MILERTPAVCATLLDGLPDSWTRVRERPGFHPELGRVTLENLLATWVTHDLAHMKQMTRTLATRYRDAVGSWNHPDSLHVLHES